MQSRRHQRRSRFQRGATAIEFAIVFPVFFLVFYSILVYGFLFLARMGLQHAAEEGARTVLQYPGAVPPGESELQLRQARALLMAAQQSRWIGSPRIEISVCQLNAICAGNNMDAATCTQAAAFTSRCQVVVVLTHSYRQDPVIPALPGFQWMLPETLQARARVLLDGRALAAR